MGNPVPPRFRKHLRLPGFDYRDEGPCFVTACTWRRRWILGSVRDGALHPSDAGIIVLQEWTRLPVRFPGLQLDAVTLMPNHVHGIVAFKTNDLANPSLSIVIGSWKSAAALRIGSVLGVPPAKVWQRGFHDCILRNQRAVEAVREYIRDNPRNWEQDSLFGRD